MYCIIWYRLWQTFIEILGTTTLTKARLKDKEHTINALIKAVRKQDLEYALLTKLFIMLLLVSVTYFISFLTLFKTILFCSRYNGIKVFICSLGYSVLTS